MIAKFKTAATPKVPGRPNLGTRKKPVTRAPMDAPKLLEK